VIYNLLVPFAAKFTVLNVFRYITFRAIYAFATALLLAIFLGPRVIAWLARLKCGQYVNENVKAHACKAGTPTMGGILLGIAIAGSTLLWSDLTNEYVWLTLGVVTGFGVIGFADDYLKVVKKRNKGLSAKAKLVGQLLIAAAAVAVRVSAPEFSTRLSVPVFKGSHPDLGWFYLPFAVFVIVGASNAVNLTDGLDGLAIGPTVVAAGMLSLFVYVAGNIVFSRYLQMIFVPGVGDVAVFCAAVAGGGLGFLWFNAYPAQVFMGDVGSLSLGGALGFVAVMCKQEFVLMIVGGVFVLETLSVILQVGYFKFTGGKRIFKMAPLHHHFELKGIPESKIIIRFWILSILLAFVALSTLKLR
jgi:phospho-N-acetylmuramoyl-pentapeptide-transferase